MPEIDLNSLSLWLAEHPHWILIALGLSAFIESLAIAGIIVPGVAILFAIAVVAGSSGIALFDALLAAFIGAVAGDLLSFFLGYHYRDTLRHMWPVSNYPNAMARGEQFFQRYGGMSVVAGRFVGPIRPVLPLVAGMLAMSPARFTAINVASALAWAPTYILPGYLVGTAIDIELPQGAGTLVLVLLGTLVLLALGFRMASQSLQQGEKYYRLLDKLGTLGTPEHAEKPFASLILFLVSTVFFLLWSYWATQAAWLETADQNWLALSLALDIPGLRTALVGITMVGDKALLEYGFVLLVLMLVVAKRLKQAIAVALTGLALSVMTLSFKELFAIARPDVLATSLPTLAYPSGHSSGSMILFGIVATLVAEKLPPKQRWQIYLVLFLPALLVALSRVLLSAHWLSDVVGGLSLGITVCAAARLTYRFISREDYPPLPNTWFGVLAIMWLLITSGYYFINFDEALLRYALAAQ